MTKSICSICEVERDITYFYKDKSRPFGFRKDCKVCCAKRINEYRKKDYVREKRKKEYTLSNGRDVTKERKKKYEQENKGKRNEYFKKKHREKYQNNIQAKIKTLIRTRIRHAIKNNIKYKSSTISLGCSIDFFKKYIESKFYNHPITEEIMSWDNNGIGKNYWQLDHIIELDSFDLTDIDQYVKACSYKNIQPLWSIDHEQKTKKYINKKRRQYEILLN
jgi:hypothetical protein